MTDKNVEVAARTAKMQTIGELIHKLSNSLTEATPESANETRLISKIAAYTSDYNVYKDEIANLEKRIEAEKPKPIVTAKQGVGGGGGIYHGGSGSGKYYSGPSYTTYATNPYIDTWDDFAVTGNTNTTTSSTGNYTYVSVNDWTTE